METPFGVAIDTTAHRLFVSDIGANRVIVYNLDSDNVLVDQIADNVLGQQNFYSVSSSISQSRLSSPMGLSFDPLLSLLYVADSSNDRILIFDVTSITDAENAVNVLGQSDFTSTTNATAQNRLNAPYGVSLDSSGNRLFVADTSNNRVMIFDVASITDGENAINVLGQANFTTGGTARTQGGLNGPRELAYDASGNRLFVGDYSNNRVMVFDVASVTDGENAVNVLGQANFTAGSATPTQSQMGYCYGVAYHDSTQRLFVSNINHNRVVVFDVASITDGENAVNVLGQPDFTTAASNTTQSGLYYPYGLALEPGGNRLFVAELRNVRVDMYDISTTTITNGENAENVVGQTDGGGGASFTTRGLYDGLPAVGFQRVQDVVVDTTTHRLFVADFYTSRVAIYNLDVSNTLVDRTIDNVLGQDMVTQGLTETTQSSLYYANGLALDPATNRLFVSDYNNDRIMIFDVASITDGENAVNVLGQTTFAGATGALSQSRLYGPAGLFFEGNSSRLFVADRLNNRVMVYDVGTITDGENAVNVLGQPDFTTGTAGTDIHRMSSPHGVHHDGANRLFVCEVNNNRVLVFDTTAITDGENAVNVLGQTDFTTGSFGTTQSKFYNPYNSVLDRAGNRLFVSDYTNDRVLVFDVSTITDGENAVNVLGQTTFTAGTNATTQSRMYTPMGMAYDPGMNRLYIGENNNNRVIVHSVGPVSPSTSTLAAVGGGDQVRVTWNSAGDDGAFNNLTGTYRIQYATYTVSWSTSSTPTDATTVTVATTSAVPARPKLHGNWVNRRHDVLFRSVDRRRNSQLVEISNTTSAVLRLV
ncbi:MAG: NHL repeat-containing protein [Elusimicrobia bacterium]|nr:NHL repeat-containing protein [Elusimicrobiota bacterium]